MKVTILSNSRRGVFYTTLEWAKRLAKRGCDVTVFFLNQSNELKNVTPSKRIKYYCLTTSDFYLNLKSIVRLLNPDRSDIIHINFSSYAPIAVLKKYTLNTPFVYTSHGLPQPWLEPKLRYKIGYTTEAALMPLITQASVVVAVSNYVKQMLKKQYGIEAEVVYNGVDFNVFKPKYKKQIKGELGYTEDAFIILFVGKLHPYKDPLTLIKAFNKVVEVYSSSYLLMVGSGELFEKVKNEISKLNLWSHIKLINYMSLEQLRICYQAADIFVLPSINEALGCVLLEAMASGLPIIASDSGACPEVIGNAGILFHQGDHLDLSEKIMDFYNNKDLSISLSNAGLKRVREVFSWEDKVDRYFEFYKQIIS